MCTGVCVFIWTFSGIDPHYKESREDMAMFVCERHTGRRGQESMVLQHTCTHIHVHTLQGIVSMGIVTMDMHYECSHSPHRKTDTHMMHHILSHEHMRHVHVHIQPIPHAQEHRTNCKVVRDAVNVGQCH